MLKDKAVNQLKADQAFFNRSTAVLEDKDSAFIPREGMLSVVQHVAHVADTVDWFIDGAFSPAGFDLDFEAHWARVNKIGTLAEARRYLDEAFRRALEVISSKTEAELLAPLPAGPIMGGSPREAIFSGITDHTAHHRGALTVYARLLGKTPAMPYMD